jgi:type II secretory pathway component GspD/PulD (secretin)
MLIRKPAAGFRSLMLAAWVAAALLPGLARADAHFHMDREADGSIRPFKAVSVPLPVFMREYARLTSTPIAVNGSWDNEIKGTVTLFLRHPLKTEVMTELVYRVLNDNGYAVVDAPAGNGWVIERTRDARDAALPILEAAEVPDSARMVTAVLRVKFVDGDSVARTMRGFMPAGSRIIPAGSVIFITDTGSNIRKLAPVISKMDTEDGARREREALATSTLGPPRVCGEQRIEKLVVEKLEIQDSGGNGQNFSIKPAVQVQGAKK